jgi:hypothetical protein
VQRVVELTLQSTLSSADAGNIASHNESQPYRCPSTPTIDFGARRNDSSFALLP